MYISGEYTSNSVVKSLVLEALKGIQTDSSNRKGSLTLSLQMLFLIT